MLFRAISTESIGHRMKRVKFPMEKLCIDPINGLKQAPTPPKSVLYSGEKKTYLKHCARNVPFASTISIFQYPVFAFYRLQISVSPAICNHFH